MDGGTKGSRNRDKGKKERRREIERKGKRNKEE
jgi:hypothetical protein